SLPLATGLALGRLAKPRPIRWPCIVSIEVIRALPLLLIFYVDLRFLGLGALSIDTGAGYLSLALTSILSRAGLVVTLSLTIYAAAANAELLRAGILSLDSG